MKLFTTIILLCFFQMAYSQHSNMVAYSSRFYLMTEPHNDTDAIKFIMIKEKAGDTIIGNKTYNKIKWTSFKDYDKKHETSFRYEFLNDSLYEERNLNNKIIHSFHIARSRQTGYLFGVKGIIQREDYTIDIHSKAFMTPKTFKYFLSGKPDLYVVIVPGKSMYMEQQASEKIYQLTGTQYNMFYNTFRNTDSVSNRFSFTIGDEIQMTAKMKAGFDFEQPAFLYYSTFKYIKDTFINNNKTLVFSNYRYDFSSAAGKKYSNVYIRCTDSGFYADKDFVPYGYKHRKIMITNEGGTQYASFRTIDTLHIGDAVFPVLCQGNHLMNGITCRVPYLLFNTYQSEGVSCRYSYIKYQGKAYGTEMNPLSDTVDTKIVRTSRKDKTTAAFDVYIKEKAIISITLENPATKQTYEYKQTLGKGVHSVSIKNVPGHVSYNLTFSYAYLTGHTQGSVKFTFDK